MGMKYRKCRAVCGRIRLWFGRVIWLSLPFDLSFLVRLLLLSRERKPREQRPNSLVDNKGVRSASRDIC